MGGVTKNIGKPFQFLNTASTLGVNKLVSKATNNLPGFLGKVARQPNDPLSFIPGARETDQSNLGYGGGPDSTDAPNDPFTFDAAQAAADQAAINNLGEKQYKELIEKAPGIVSNTLAQVLPSIAEDYNAGHLINSTAYPQEVARQASNLTQNLVLPAITGRQNYQASALQRGLSLEDFVNEANVAKAIGAQMAPQVNNGKGTAVSGLGAGASAGSAFGPWGAAIGAGLGYLAGGGGTKAAQAKGK